MWTGEILKINTNRAWEISQINTNREKQHQQGREHMKHQHQQKLGSGSDIGSDEVEVAGFELELCVAVVEGSTPLGRPYTGCCSKYLASLVLTKQRRRMIRRREDWIVVVVVYVYGSILVVFQSCHWTRG